MPEFKPENPGQHRGPEDFKEKFFSLIAEVVKKFGSLEMVAAAVDKDCDIAAAVVVRWFQTGVAPQSTSISRRIVGSLEYLAVVDPRQVGFGTKKLIPPMAPKPKPEELPKTEAKEEPIKK